METYNYWQDLKKSFMIYAEFMFNDRKVAISHGRGFDLLHQYALSVDAEEYTPELGYAFVESEKTKGYRGHTTLDRRRATIRHLNKHLFGSAIYQRKPRELLKYKTSYVPPQCPEQFKTEFESFLQRLKTEGLKDNTIAHYRFYCIKYMLCVFDQRGTRSWEEIDARTLTSAFTDATNKNSLGTHARRLFGYLTETGVIPMDYSCVLPVVSKPKTLPSVFSEDEVKQILGSIETITPLGKRNYAIILIALRLGLRASDIAGLRFENLDFENSIVKFTQIKTSVPHQLPLPVDVEAAVSDYIKNGREPSTEAYVFLDGNGKPLTRHAVSNIGSRHIKQSGINIGTRHHGTHALRMTFASQLIKERIPYDVVRYALGHVSTNSTRHYVQFDTERLRACALEVPQPSGLLRKYLENVGAEV